MTELRKYVGEAMEELVERLVLARAHGREVLREQSAQGTTEYAILVGVLVGG